VRASQFEPLEQVFFPRLVRASKIELLDSSFLVCVLTRRGTTTTTTTAMPLGEHHHYILARYARQQLLVRVFST